MPEKHFEMGQTIAVEKSITNGWPLPPQLDVHKEMRLVMYTADTVPESEVAQKMKEVGMARATLFGWQNTYQFTKAMAEMVIHESRGEVPVVIVRPSFIESTLKEPLPGWIQGNRCEDFISTICFSKKRAQISRHPSENYPYLSFPEFWSH